MAESKQPLGTMPNYWRQLDVFDPDKFNEEIHILGAGAAGSWTAYLLAKLGVRKLHVWDFDTVVEHNCPNQIFGRGEVGMLKIEALKDRLWRDCACEVVTHKVAIADPDSEEGKRLLEIDPEIEMVTPKLKGIVFLAMDSMSARWFAWENCIKLNPYVKLMVEIRLAAEFGQVHVVNPLHLKDINGFEATLCKNDEAEESACTNRMIATTVAAICSIAAHKVVKFASGGEPMKNVKVEEGADHSNYDMLCIRPIVMTTANWSK